MDDKFWAQYHFLEAFSDAFITEYTDDIEPLLADNFQYHCLDGVTHLDKSAFLQNFPNDLKHEFTVMMYVRKTAQPVLMFGPKCKNNSYPCVTVELGVDNKILSMTHSYAVLKDLISANTKDYADFKAFCQMATSMPRTQGKDEDKQTQKENEFFDEKQGRTWLMKRIADGSGDYSGDHAIISLYFEEGDKFTSHINSFDEDGHNAIHYCVDVLIKNHKYKTPEDENISCGPWDTNKDSDNLWVKTVRNFVGLVSIGVSINGRKPKSKEYGALFHPTPLEYAIEQGAPYDVIKLLLKYGAYPETFDMCDATPLFTSVASENADAVRALLEAGANPNHIMEGGDTPLGDTLYAIYARKRLGKFNEIIRLLLEFGANPNIKYVMQEVSWIYGSVIKCEPHNKKSRLKARNEFEKLLGIKREMDEIRKMLKEYIKKFPIDETATDEDRSKAIYDL